jgi:hypothetical protein
MHKPTYKCWKEMKSRCLDHKNASWQHYGARGIKVCSRWQNSYDAFLADMGVRPAKLLSTVLTMMAITNRAIVCGYPTGSISRFTGPVNIGGNRLVN